MSEYVYLTGSEQVKNAGQEIGKAAERFSYVQREAQAMLDRQERAMSDWLDRLERILEADRAERSAAHAMTRKHFKALAQALAYTRPDPTTIGYEARASWKQTRSAIADVCAKFNGNFDRDRFYVATEESWDS